MSKSGATAFVSVMLLVVGVVGFGLSVLWGKITGRDMDRDTILFLVKMWGGIVLVFSRSKLHRVAAGRLFGGGLAACGATFHRG